MPAERSPIFHPSPKDLSLPHGRESFFAGLSGIVGKGVSGIRLWFANKTFSHGIHPGEHKTATHRSKIRRLGFAPRLFLPLAQHIGKPARPLVTPGQEVVRGEPIAAADGFVSAPIHAPATGVIEAIELMPSVRGPKTETIILKVYEADDQQVRYELPQDPNTMAPQAIIDAIRDSGMVGLGGAAFPTHVKLSVPEGHSIDTFVVNGCECEPYLTTDHRVMVEQTESMLDGIRFCLRATGAKQAVIGVEDNKPDAIIAIRKALREDDPISVEAVQTKYPQGAEKLLIKTLLGREVPSGGHSYDVGVCSNNVGTLSQIGTLLPRGQGLIERVITVDGPAVKKPGNYIVPLGTPIRFVLEQVGTVGKENEVIVGGPMMGNAVASLDVPITKGVSGLLVFNEEAIAEESRKRQPCIKCGLCVQACPMHLNPTQLGLLAAKRQYEEMEQRYHLNDCFECGCCTYVCPAAIPLVQYFRIAKAINREQKSKAA